MTRTIHRLRDRLKTRSALKAALVAGIAGGLLTGCASINPLAKPDPRWADFKTWTKVTEGTEPTGDPSKLLGVVHKGENGYRDVYVNDIAKDALLGDAPNDFPEGSVIVKHQFDNKADWEAGENGDVTVSIKSADDGTRNKDNWTWAAGMKAKAGPSDFCSGCHTAALSLYDSDFVFTTAGFLEKHAAQ